MKLLPKFFLILLFTTLTPINYILLAFFTKGSTLDFDEDYPTQKEIKHYGIKTQYSFEIQNGDTIKKRELRFNNNGQIIYSFFFEYNQFPTEQFSTYDSLKDIRIFNEYQDKQLIQSNRITNLKNNWEFHEVSYPNRLLKNEKFYINRIEHYDSTLYQKSYIKKVCKIENSEFNDTITYHISKEQYDINNLLMYEEEYYDNQNTILTKYTYNDNHQIVSISSNIGTYTLFNYRDGLKYHKTEYNEDSVLVAKTYYNKNEKTEHIYFYNDTNALIHTQTFTYDSNGLISLFQNYKYLDYRMQTDTVVSIYNNGDVETAISSYTVDTLDYTLQPDTLFFIYEFYN